MQNHQTLPPNTGRLSNSAHPAVVYASIDDFEVPGVKIKLVGVGAYGVSVVKHALKDFTEGILNLSPEADVVPEIAAADMVFIVVGLSPEGDFDFAASIARAAKGKGILMIGLAVALPGAVIGRAVAAVNDQFREFEVAVDSMLVIDGQDAAALLVRDTALALNSEYPIIPIDFLDYRAVLTSPGPTAIATAVASGPDRVQAALDKVSTAPAFGPDRLLHAQAVLVMFSCSMESMRLSETKRTTHTLRSRISSSATFLVAAFPDPQLGEAVRITFVAKWPPDDSSL